ncbi:MAG: hypothetical protein R3E50_13965 [Halioglobus sp.]
MSTLHALTVPKWGMSMEEGEITEWRVAVGDQLAVGDENRRYRDIQDRQCGRESCRRQAGEDRAKWAAVTSKVGALLGVVATGDASEQDTRRLRRLRARRRRRRPRAGR